MENPEKAKETYLKTLEINPNLPDILNNLGVLYKCNFIDYEKAKECYFKALTLLPNDGDNSNIISTTYNLACTYSLQKNKEEALDYLTKSIALDIDVKSDAQTDTDFEWLWEDNDFLSLVK